MTLADLPVVRRVVRFGDDEVITLMTFVGVVIVSLIAAFGRTPVTTTMVSTYLVVQPLYVLYNGAFGSSGDDG